MEAMDSYICGRIKYYIVTKKEILGEDLLPSKNMFEIKSTGVKIDVDLKYMQETIPFDLNNKWCCYQNNSAKKAFFDKLAEDAKENCFKDVAGVCFIFLTFLGKDMKEGEETILIGSGPGNAVTITEIFDTVKKIKGLSDKPKIFLIQADDMSLLPKETKAKCVPEGETHGLKTDGPKMKTIPTDADRLVIKCTIPQKWAEKHQDWDENKTLVRPRTSFFIRAFCDELQENKNMLDLLSLSPNINRRVKKMIEDCKRTPETVKTLNKLKYPTCSSTLTRAFKFPLQPSSTKQSALPSPSLLK